MNILRALAACTLVLVAACGSDKEPKANNEQPAASTAASSAAQAGAKGSGADDLSNWIEPGAAPETPVAATRERLADPDAVIDRYRSECSGGTRSPQCHALRLDVEAIFLASILAVRSSNSAVVDPSWYRLAAASETPQLACIGLVELSYDPKRTAKDEDLIVRALESPYPVVRATALSNASKIPVLAGVDKRIDGYNRRSLSGLCVDDTRDPVYGAKWAGNYPGAQYRFFASSDARRWFTTPDPVEKVIAWFAARGKPARTAQELTEDAQAKMVEKMMELTQNPEQDNSAQVMQLLAGQGSQADWSQALRYVQGTGEIRYVMIADNQAVAIFQDDVLKATSIVAPRPAEPVDLTPDIEAAKEEAETRSILGY
jgi:hypothetical protein